MFWKTYGPMVFSFGVIVYSTAVALFVAQNYFRLLSIPSDIQIAMASAVFGLLICDQVIASVTRARGEEGHLLPMMPGPALEDGYSESRAKYLVCFVSALCVWAVSVMGEAWLVSENRPTWAYMVGATVLTILCGLSIGITTGAMKQVVRP